MTKFNIFQGNNLIKGVIAKCLKYEPNQESTWFTEDIYFEAFFYLSKRFGQPKILDDYKDGGTWDFSVKEYTIRLHLNSSWLEVIIFGDEHKNPMSKNNFRNYSMRSPYMVKYWREQILKKSLFIDMFKEKRTKSETKVIENLFEKFKKEHNIDDTWTDEKFKEEGKENDWFDYVNNYNNSLININRDEFEKKYGSDYKNAKTKHALKTLEQFLNNMMTPIYVRDVAFNIKGNCDSREFNKYIDNIEIKLKK